MLRSPLIVLMAILTFAPAVGAARSGQLWTEKDRGAPALANVPDFAALAQQVGPAVVSIQVEHEVKMSRGRMPRGMAPPFFDFFRDFGPTEPGQGLGTGFVINRDGLIITNNHVVENADRIMVTVQQRDGGERTMSAKVLGTAPKYDVALLQTEEKLDVEVAPLGDSDGANIGDWVMAIGNPFGLSHSVSVGIISAKERREIAPSGRSGLYDFIQTDASINPGNSGGPLINMKGEVIGVNTAINAQGSGIGFAIPINMVKSILPDLKEKGRFERSWIGIQLQSMSPGLASTYGLTPPRGALVADVVPDSPAQKAGLRDGDVVLEFDGKPIRNAKDLELLAGMAGVGRKVKVSVWRDKKAQEKTITLEAFPDQPRELAQSDEERGETGELGMTVANISQELREYFELDATRGVVVKEVRPGSPAAREGLRPGDVVTSFNGRPVADARAFAKAVSDMKSGQAFRLKVKRGGVSLFVGLVKP